MSNKKIKRYLLAAGVSLSAISLLYIINTANQPTPISPPPTHPPATKQNATSIVLPPGTILPKLKLKAPRNISSPIPETLPMLYSRKTKLDESLASQIAKSIGFTGTPKRRLNNNETASLIWEKENFERVSIYLIGRTINYTNESLKPQNLNQQLVIQNISKFLDNINLIANTKYFIQDIKYYKRLHDQEATFSSASNANYAVASITQKINGFPIIGLNFTNTFDNIAVLGNEVYSAHLTLPNTTFATEIPLQLASPQELLTRFENAKLISYRTENKPISDDNDYPDKPLEPTDTDIAYFYREIDSAFIPVLVVNAKGKNNQNLTVTATFVINMEK